MALQCFMALCCSATRDAKRRPSLTDLLNDADAETAYPSSDATSRSSSIMSDGRSGSPSSGSTTTLSKEVMDDVVGELINSVKPWEDGKFTRVKKLEDAVGNFGHVDMMRREEDGVLVAVKQMPSHWVCTGPRSFHARNPDAAEQPWLDLAVLRHLNRMSFPHVCELLGVLRDEERTYVVTSLATEGDLFTWCTVQAKPGREREATLHPVVVEVFSAVRMLHEHGIAHRDLSLENVLLTIGEDGARRVRLIDFGMATTSRWCFREVRGKVPYRAPEMHLETQPYCPFMVDAFALGVLLFCMATSDYPWASTKAGKCKLFEYIKKYGLRQFLERRKCRKADGKMLIEVLSPGLAQVVQGLLALETSSRYSMGGPALGGGGDGAAKTVWQAQWLGDI
mmetsp:Transcript_63974/g.164678  ORF Transcript_63974/g.164678 Transcript_63974/m.164678 type:complete len:395 (+) Transcript_63974:92-1276(+)